MQLMLIRMDPKIRVIFTLAVYFLSCANAFDFRRTAMFPDPENIKLPSEVMRPVEPRIWFRPPRMTLNPPPPHPLPPFNPQSRVIVARLDDGRPYGQMMGMTLPMSTDMLEKSVEATEPIKDAPIKVLEQTMDKVTDKSEALKDEAMKNTVPSVSAKPEGRLDVLQDVKKELKEAGLISKVTGPSALKVSAATVAVEKLEDAADLKENVLKEPKEKSDAIPPSVIPKKLEGLVEVKDGLISFPADKLSEVTDFLNNLKEELKNEPQQKVEAPLEKLSDIADLKEAALEKAAVPLDVFNELKAVPLEKIEDLKDVKPDLVQVTLQKVDNGMDIKNSLPTMPMDKDKVTAVDDKMEDLKNVPIEKVEDLIEAKDDGTSSSMDKISAGAGILENVKDVTEEKISAPLQIVGDLKERDLEKDVDVPEIKPDLAVLPIEKLSDSLDFEKEIVPAPAPAKQITEAEDLLSSTKGAPKEILNSLTNLPAQKIEEAVDLKDSVIETPMDKLEGVGEKLDDVKDSAILDKMTSPSQTLEDLKTIPIEKLEDSTDMKEDLLSEPLEKVGEVVDITRDLKDAPVDKTEDWKDVVANAFDHSSMSERKDYFKRIVSMMSKDDLADLQEALLSAVAGVQEGISAPKVADAKNDLQEAVHELIETQDDELTDPDRKGTLEEIEHVLEEMKAPVVEHHKDSFVTPMTIPTIVHEKTTSVVQFSSADKMGSLLDKQDIMLNKLLSSSPGQGQFSNIERDAVMGGGLGLRNGRNEPLPIMRARGMIGHPGRRISKRSIVYGSGTVAHEIRDFPPPSRLRVPLFTTFRHINNAGPPEPYPRSKDSLSLPLLDITEPATDKILLDIKEGLRYVLQTKNDFTFAIHGTGTTGAHAIIDNLVEPEDKVLVFIHGYWGGMLANMSERIGAHVIRYKTAPGARFSLEEIESGLRKYRPDVVAMVYGESSTTVYQPLDGVGDLCHKYGALLAVDVVAVAGIQPVLMDKYKIDAVYTSSSKGIGGVAGLAPISLSPKAVEKLRNRLTPPRAYQTDLLRQAELWNTSKPDRVHFQSLSLPLLYALREALASIAEERIENTFRRHSQATDILNRGIDALGLEHYVKNPKDRMVGIAAIKPPRGKDPKKIADYMLKNYNMLISSGFGPTEGQVLRISTFAANADSLKVTNVLRALKGALSARETNKTT